MAVRERRSVLAADMRATGPVIALVICLLGIPSALIIKPLGAAGTPADIIAIGLLAWWAAMRLIRPAGPNRRTTAVHLAFFAFTATMLASYAHGMLRPITGAETSSADRGLLAILAWAGMTIGIADGVRTRDALERVLRVLMVGGAVVASLGILQFFTGIDLAGHIRIPGFVANHPFALEFARSNFRRVSATTMHPIEFGVVLALILPVSLHFAVQSKTAAMRRRAFVCACLMIVALPMTVARSAILGLVVGLIVVVPALDRKNRIRALVVAPFLAVALKLAVPGLLGTVRNLFLHAGQDPSVQNRLGDYVAAGHYIGASPLLGRGFFTFLPEMYRTLDNQYMGTLIEAGFLGLAALIGLMVVGMAACAGVRARVGDAGTRSLAQSLLASMAVALVTFFTFDAMAFPMATGVFFIVLGAIGALLRIHPSPPSVVARPVRARWVAPAIYSMSTLAVAIVCVGGLNVIRHTAPQYEATGRVVLSGEAGYGGNVYLRSRYLGDFAQLLQRSATSTATREKIASAGNTAFYEVAVGDGSLNPGTDLGGTGGVLTVASTSASPVEALNTANAVMATISHDLQQWQTDAGVSQQNFIRVQASFPPTGSVQLPDSIRRAQVAYIALIVWLGYMLARGLARRFAASGQSPVGERVHEQQPIIAAAARRG
jgi:O-antigen ligase